MSITVSFNTLEGVYNNWINDISMIRGSNFAQKFKVLGIASNLDESVGLVVANPTQLVSSQTDVGSERYCNLFIKSNRQKK
jgi:hypothetical protein